MEHARFADRAIVTGSSAIFGDTSPGSTHPAARQPGLRAVATIWQRFGPYHLARLKGAAAVLAPHGWQVIGVEVAGRDHYAWNPAYDASVVRHTLFPDGQYSNLKPREVWAQTARALDHLLPDAVCVNGWSVPEAVSALHWCRRRRTRAILMSETFNSAFNPIKEAFRRWRVSHFDAAMVGGRLQVDYLRRLGFNGKTLESGYDAVDNNYFAGPAGPPPWVDSSNAHRYFFANTRLIERKAVDVLLRAYARYRAMSTKLCGSEKPWSLVVSGSGAMQSSLRTLAVDLCLSEHVLWPGFLQYEELPSAYRFAGAFVHPARREPWGLVVNEAAAAGLPLLVGRSVGAASELVREGENGFLVNPDDVDGFANLLLRVSSLTTAQRHAMGKRSKAIVSAFGPQRFGEAMRKCLGLES